MSFTTGSTFSGKNIAAAALLTSFTIPIAGRYSFQLYFQGVAGGADYVVNVRRKRLGVGEDFPLVPKTTYTAGATEYSFGFPSIEVDCRVSDLVSFYGLGKATDTSITGVADIFMNDSVRSTTPENTFDVSATGEGGVDLNNIKQASAPTTFTNITIPTVTNVGTVTGNVNGSVDSVTDPVTVTGTVAADVVLWRTTQPNVLISGRVDAYVGAMVASTINSIADQVWDELLAGHIIAGSAGAMLTTAGVATDPLLNAVPGAYLGGTAGAALGRIGTGLISPYHFF